MGQVEFHRPTATCLKVDEQRPESGVQYVAGMWFAVQQLFYGATLDNRSCEALLQAAEKLPILIAQSGRQVTVGQKLPCFRNPIGEAQCGHLDLSHADVQAP